MNLSFNLIDMKLSPKYQVVIPENVRQALDLKPGMQIDVIAKGEVAYLVPVRTLTKVRERISKYLDSSDTTSLREKKDRKI
jgi:AbrB family looped-hinge helix DNA binding protein